MMPLLGLLCAPASIVSVSIVSASIAFASFPFHSLVTYSHKIDWYQTVSSSSYQSSSFDLIVELNLLADVVIFVACSLYIRAPVTY